MTTTQVQQEDVGNALKRFLAAGSVDVPLPGGRVRMVFTSLPGRTVCVGMYDDDGVLWIACDDGKPWARGHAAEMIADAGLRYCGNDLYITAMRKIPTRGTRGGCRLALLR